MEVRPVSDTHNPSKELNKSEPMVKVTAVSNRSLVSLTVILRDCQSERRNPRDQENPILG